MVGGDDSTLSFLGLFLVSKPFHQIISFNPTYSMRSSMPFPIYLRRLRFREVNPEITLLVKKKNSTGEEVARHFKKSQLYLTFCLPS